MRHVRNIFEEESYRGTGIRSISSVTLTLVICSALSILAAVNIFINFGAITARIAISVASLLSSGFPILAVIVIIAYVIARLKWKLRRFFWGW